jgi:chromosome segregation ATPase
VYDLVKGLEEDTNDRFELETARVKALKDKVECLQQKTKDSIDRGIAAAEDQSKVDAMKGDIVTLQNQNKDYKSSIDALTDSVKDMESKAKRFERKADHINAIGSALQNLEKAIKALDAKLERLERQEKDIQCQTRSLMEGLRNSMNDCLKQTYTDFSGLTQRVKILEGSRQKADSDYTATMLNQENRARNWEAQLYGVQNGAGYGVFVPSYVNGSVRR